MIDLDKFCEKDGVRYYLEKPFRLGGYIYATNGHLAVRIPDDGREAAEAYKSVSGIGKIFADAIARDGEQFTVPNIALPDGPDEEKCPACNGLGEPECDMEHMHDCPECDGTGMVETCIRVSVGVAEFQRKYLRLLAELPNCKIFVQRPDRSAYFTFDGGEGCLMPLRK
jgi:hypothetical protein